MKFDAINSFVQSRLRGGLSAKDAKELVNLVTGGDAPNKREVAQLEKVKKLFSSEFTKEGKAALNKLIGEAAHYTPPTSSERGGGRVSGGERGGGRVSGGERGGGRVSGGERGSVTRGGERGGGRVSGGERGSVTRGGGRVSGGERGGSVVSSGSNWFATSGGER